MATLNPTLKSVSFARKMITAGPLRMYGNAKTCPRTILIMFAGLGFVLGERAHSALVPMMGPFRPISHQMPQIESKQACPHPDFLSRRKEKTLDHKGKVPM